FGAGGAGGYFGAQLTRAGADVIFIARGDHLSAIRKHGLCIESPAGEAAFRPTLATDDPTQVGKADVVLVGVKAWQVTQAAEAIRARDVRRSIAKWRRGAVSVGGRTGLGACAGWPMRNVQLGNSPRSDSQRWCRQLH